MNYFVLQNADTAIGNTIAFHLARQKKNLILIGSSIVQLNDLKIKIRSSYSVYVYCIEFRDTSLEAMIRLCEAINDNYFIEGLINIEVNGNPTDLNESHLHDLSSRLVAELPSNLCMVHQLLPNLMLCADAVWFRILCNQNRLPIGSAVYHISETGELSKAQMNFDFVPIVGEQKCSLTDNCYYVSN